MTRLMSIALRWLALLALLLAHLPAANPHPVAPMPDGLHPMPPPPGILTKLYQEGRPLPTMQMKQERGIDQPNQFPTPPSGNFNLLAVAVHFTDKPGTVTLTYFDNLIFAPPGSGSVAHYYHEISYGSLTLVTVNTPSTMGWVRPKRSYNGTGGYVNADGIAGTSDDWGWGAFPLNIQGIVSDTIPLIDPVVDFSQYDNDNDGFVDSVVFIHAGPGAEITGSPSDAWSCAWNMSASNGPGPLVTQDGVSVDNFTFNPEYIVNAGDHTIGVYCHELGHSLFGLPDVYDLDASSYGVGDWSLMGTGAWNGPLMWVPWIGWIPGGGSPAWPDAWCRTVMGFEHPLPTDGDMPGFAFPPVESGPALVVRLRSPQLGPKEYFLVENRQRWGFDSFLPGTGLLIWRVDEDKWNQWEFNTYECTLSPHCQCPTWHYLLALEQADGLLDLENKTNTGDTGDPFPGASGNTTFGFGTTPESGSWYTSPCPASSCITVTNIAILPGGPPDIIAADLHVACQSPGACVNVLPTSQVGWGQAGITVTYRASVQNCSAVSDTFDLAAGGVWSGAVYDRATGHAITQTGTVYPGQAEYVDVIVTVPASARSGDSDVTTLSAASKTTPGVSAASLLTTHVPRCVLLVDDDRSMPDVEGVYTKALIHNNVAFDYWDTDAWGSPGLNALSAPPAVIWFTGTPWPDTLSPREEVALATYLDNGGQLFLCSQEYLGDVGRSAFSREYLRVATYTTDTGTNVVQGMVGDPVGGGLGPYTLSPAAALSDRINPHPPASGAFVDGAGLTNGLTYDAGTWRALFLAWPFENLAQPDADAVMRSAVNWFGIPMASFTPSATTVGVRNVVTFTNTSVNATSYWWDFGDGIGVSTATHPTYTYPGRGWYTVTLLAFNATCSSSGAQQIHVIEYLVYLPMVLKDH
jgi:M6 family metalloprotease-like protein